ncbi:MAG: protein kinase [Verrucomicrobia bacterium]|nr:protein kinase [Verrucomicrobiota bacterium]
MTTTIASRYQILRELGRGGMGVVYLVEHVHTGERHALKVLLGHTGASTDVLERFRREARAPARIRSEGVVKITDFDVAPELGGAPFLVMELLEGQDVDKLLETHGRLSPEFVVWLFGELASVLDRAHAAGVVHRDLKPENLFLHRRRDGTEVLKVVDFGISRISGEGLGDMTAAALTKSGAMMGTPLYMSPEQARGLIQQIGPATDMWSLGLIAHRLLTGDVYWTATTLAELMVQIIAEPMAPPSSRWPALPRGFDAWFAKACDRDPGRRFVSVAELARSLASALGVGAPTISSVPSETVTDVPMSAVTTGSALAQSTASVAHTVGPSDARPQSGRWRVIAAALAVTAAGVVVGVGVAAGPSGTSSSATSPTEPDEPVLPAKKQPTVTGLSVSNPPPPASTSLAPQPPVPAAQQSVLPTAKAKPTPSSKPSAVTASATTTLPSPPPPKSYDPTAP